MNVCSDNDQVFTLDHLLFEDIKLLESAQINNLNKIALHANYLDKISPVSNLTNLRVLTVDDLFIPVDMSAKTVNGEEFDEFLSRLVMKDMRIKIPGTVRLEGVSILIPMCVSFMPPLIGFTCSQCFHH